MRRQGKTRELTVGITMTLALVVFAGMIMFLSRENTVFHARRTFRTTTSNSLGLKTGSPVVMGGVQIGTVTSVSLPRDIHGSDIDIGMSVDRTYTDRIREGSIASVGFITLLSGEKYVNISAGDATKPELPNASLIPPDTTETLLETGQNMAETLQQATGELREILVGINRGEGLVGQLVKAHDPYFGEQLVGKIEGTFDRTNHLLEKVERGEGTLGKLISDPAYAEETLGSMKSATARLDRILAMIETGNGGAGELIQPNGQGKELIDDLRSTSASLKAVSARLETSTGVIGKLLNDQEYSEALAGDLRKITSSLSSILHKIDSGEGSLGGLVNDPSVYRGLQNIVAGIQGSKTAKFVVNHYGKKGAKINAEPEKPPETTPPK